MVKNAEHKQAEIAQLKMELKRTQEQREKEIEQLKMEKQQLKKMLRDYAEHDPKLLLEVDVNIPLTDSATSPMSPTRQEPLGASSSSDEGNGVESSDSCEIRISNKDNKDKDKDWDRTSLCSQLSDMSLACLQDKIFQMEETHYRYIQ